MANKNLLKSKAVIKAISIGLAAMMAMTPVVGATDVYADDVDGNEGEQVAETKPQESVNLSGSAETSSSNEDSSDSSSSESITGKADVTTDANGDITVEATVEGESVDIDETKQSDSNVVVNADGSITETDTVLSKGTDKSTEGDTTTNTKTEVNTTIKTTTAADIKDYDNVSSEKTEGSTVVQTTVTSVSVAITTTETTITTSYDEQVTDPAVIAIIEAAIANPQVDQIREDETGKYIKIGDAEYKYTQTTNTVPVDITSEEVLENINKELLKEDKETHTDDNGNNYIKVGDTWYEYKTETVDSSSELGQKTMDNLKSEAENVTAEETVINDDNSVTETKVLTVDGRSYTYKVTTAVLEVTDKDRLKQIKYDVEHESDNVEVKGDKTYVTIDGVTYTYSSEAGTDVVTVDEKSDKVLFDKIQKAAAESVKVNEDGTKTVTVGGVEYKYTAETSEDIILDATNTNDKATINEIKAALEEAEKKGKQIATKTIDDVEYKIIVIGGVTYGFHSESNSDTQDVTSEKEIMAALKEAYEKNQGVPNGDGTYSINLDGVRYIYTPGKEEKGVAKEVSFLKNLEGYNMISLGNMKVNQHVNGAIIVCGTLEGPGNGDVYVDNNRNADSKKDIGTVSMINKADNNCNVNFVPLSQNVDKDNGKNGHVHGKDISNNNAEDTVIGGFVKDITQKTADKIIEDIKGIYDSIIAKFGSNDSYVEDGITFKLINSAERLSDHINGEGGAAVSGDEKKRDDKISQGYYLTENIVYVVAKDVTNLIVSQLRAIVLAPFTNVSIEGGESAGTVIGAYVTNTAQTHTGVLKYEEETKSTPDAAKKETKSTIENAFKTIVRNAAKATTNSSTPKASYKKTSYEAASVSAKMKENRLSTEAWKRKDTKINKVKVSELSGQKITILYGTKTPTTPPTTPPVTPPPTTPPVTPPPTTPPTTPPPTTPPVTPPSITPPTPVTPDTPTEGVLGERREVSPDAAVLGARRRVLGARRGVLGEKRVLGARTEDTSNAAGAVGVILGSVALSGVWMTLRRKKKIQ